MKSLKIEWKKKFLWITIQLKTLNVLKHFRQIAVKVSERHFHCYCFNHQSRLNMMVQHQIKTFIYLLVTCVMHIRITGIFLFRTLQQNDSFTIKKTSIWKLNWIIHYTLCTSVKRKLLYVGHSNELTNWFVRKCPIRQLRGYLSKSAYQTKSFIISVTWR